MNPVNPHVERIYMYMYMHTLCVCVCVCVCVASPHSDTQSSVAEFRKVKTVFYFWMEFEPATPLSLPAVCVCAQSQTLVKDKANITAQMPRQLYKFTLYMYVWAAYEGTWTQGTQHSRQVLYQWATEAAQLLTEFRTPIQN